MSPIKTTSDSDMINNNCLNKNPNLEKDEEDHHIGIDKVRDHNDRLVEDEEEDDHHMDELPINASSKGINLDDHRVTQPIVSS